MASVVARYCDIQGGGFPGTGNLDIDPMFVDPLGPDGLPGTVDDDLRLQAVSPCIDAADSTAPPIDPFEPMPFDLDGNARFIDDTETEDTGVEECPIVDMGAYEFQEGNLGCCRTDLNSDGYTGAADLAELLGNWGPCAEPCEPGDPAATCAADFNGDCDVETIDLAILLGAWGLCIPGG